MKKCIRIFASLAFLFVFASGCVIDNGGDEKNEVNAVEDKPIREDQKPKPPDADAPEIDVNFNDTVQIN